VKIFSRIEDQVVEKDRGERIGEVRRLEGDEKARISDAMVAELRDVLAGQEVGLMLKAGTVELTASGTSPVAVNVASGELIGHKRIYYKITRVSGTITNPVITNTTTGETFSITGSLTAANEFYYVDPYAGRLKKGTGTIEAATDEIGNMSGRFIPREAAAMALSLSFTGGGTATFDVHHLNTMYS